MILRELVARLGLDVDQAAFTTADRLMSVVKGGLIAAGAAAGAVAVGIGAAVGKTARYADQVSKLAQRTGIGVESLQALQYAAERADLNFTDLEMALNTMARRGVKDFEAEIRKAAEEFAAMPDGAGKAAIALERFGRSGTRMIPWLNGGTKAIDEFLVKARDMGLVLSADEVAEGAALWDVIEDLQGHLRGLAHLMGVPLLGAARKWLGTLVEWIRLHRQVAAQRFQTFVEVLGKAFTVAWRLGEPLLDLLARLLDSSIATGIALAGLGLVVAAPWALPAAAIAAILILLEELWGWVTGKRRTLLEDWLGPFEEFIKIDPSDSPLLSGLKMILKAVTDLDGALRSLQETWRKLTKDPVGTVVRYSPFGLALNELWNLDEVRQLDENGNLVRPTPARATPEVMSGVTPRAPTMDDLSAGFSARFSRPTLNLGGVTINAAPGADGRELGEKFMSTIEPRLDDWWNTKMSEAAPAVVR